MLACRAMSRAGWIGVAQALATAGFFSTGAILVRWAQELSPVQVTCLRMLLGGLFVGVAAWCSGERLRLQLAEYRRLIPVGDGKTRVAIYIGKPVESVSQEVQRFVQSAMDEGYAGLEPFIAQKVAELLKAIEYLQQKR